MLMSLTVGKYTVMHLSKSTYPWLVDPGFRRKRNLPLTPRARNGLGFDSHTLSCTLSTEDLWEMCGVQHSINKAIQSGKGIVRHKDCDMGVVVGHQLLARCVCMKLSR
jgi:hypothetical protein